jgi:hypothetical protein
MMLNYNLLIEFYNNHFKFSMICTLNHFIYTFDNTLSYNIDGSFMQLLIVNILKEHMKMQTVLVKYLLGI